MKCTKLIILLVLIGLISFPLAGEKRIARTPMKELTYRNSPSYVPFPYPKNRREILADFKYYVQTYCADETIHRINISDSPFTANIISLEVIKPDSKYRFGEIIKVKNRSVRYCDEYSWLIHILDKNGDIIMRVDMLASGLFGALAPLIDDYLQVPPKVREMHDRFRKVHNEKDITYMLAQTLGYALGENSIQEMSRLAARTRLGNLIFPLWEITMVDGHIYYYSIMTGSVYEADRIVPWKVEKRGGRPSEHDVAQHWDYIPDSINDEIIVLKEVTKK